MNSKKMKYCLVASCEHNLGTSENIRMFRPPRIRAVTEKWNRALGLNENTVLHGLICIKHFEDQDLKKCGDKIQLLPHSIPSIFNSTEQNELPEIDRNIDEGWETDSVFDELRQMNLTEMNSELGQEIAATCESCEWKDILIIKYKAEILKHRQSLKKAQNKIYYLETTKAKFNDSMKKLKEQNLLDNTLYSTLQALKDDELLRVLHGGIKSNKKYSENVRHFCLAMHYYSPRAYEFIRKTFNNHLPHSKTIQNWYADSDIRGDPGLQEYNIDRLKNISNGFKKEYQTQILCSLVFDEINLRKQVFWSIDQLECVGYVPQKESVQENQKNSIINQSIVFILNGINVNFEFPVAYYLIDSLDKEQRKDLLKDVISAVTACCIQITNITFDGLASNIGMCELFGSDLDVHSSSFQPFFANPVNDEKIFIILDPCHMEKLVRNTLANKEVIFNSKNEKIEWKFFESLYSYSRKYEMKTHKLTKKHLQCKRNAMNVRLAVETLSQSVANSLKYLSEQNHPDFQNVGATIEFIQIMNKLFDTFNSRNSTSKDIFKQALGTGNKRIIFDFFESTIEYLKALKIEDIRYSKGKNGRTVNKTVLVPLLKSRNKTAFRGFIIDMYSVMSMYTKYVEQDQILKEIPTYYLLQDVVELFFGKIRSCCGFNNNPNVMQFKGAYRKLQSNIKIQASVLSNCRIFDTELPSDLNYSNVYFVSSRRAAIVPSNFEELYETQKQDILMEVAKLDELESCNHLFDSPSDFTAAYIASSIERKIQECPQFHCENCRSIFDENVKVEINSRLLNSRPCVDTFEICKHAEKFFKLYNMERANNRFNFRVLYCLIFRSMNLDIKFSNSDFGCDASHKYHLIKCIVGEYISLRAVQKCKDITLDQQQKIFRQHLNHLVLNNGQ